MERDKERSLFERVREAIVIDDPQLLRDVAWAERALLNRVMHVGTNGRAPWDWSLERWMAVLTFVFGVCGGLMFVGQWKGGIEKDVNEIKSAISALTRTVTEQQDTTARQVQEIAAQVQALTPPPVPSRRTPIFAPDSQFFGSGRRPQ
jgi:hypothetical protein